MFCFGGNEISFHFDFSHLFIYKNNIMILIRKYRHEFIYKQFIRF